MKHNNTFFMQVTRELFTEDYQDLSYKAKWLFVTLNELEQRYTGHKENYFYRSNKDLAEDSGMSLSMTKKAKKELLETNLIQSWQMHWIDNLTGKKSKKKVTAYRILK